MKKRRPIRIYETHAEVELTKGYKSLIDLDDVPLVSQTSWIAQVNNTDGSVRAAGVVNGRRMLLHTLLMNPKKPLEVDHINHDSLDNRRCNLRVVTHQQNATNRRRFRNNSSGFKGVSKLNGKWAARIVLGSFDSPEDAARSYDKAALELHGEFACLNFPEEHEQAA